jgi:AcrR family transcriptional regulator
MKLEEKKQEKRAAILEAALCEFAGKRFDAVKLDDIAARAGVGKGTLYLYFKNKEDLFFELTVDGMDEILERINEIRAMKASYEERFFLLGSELFCFFQRRVGVVRLMHQSGSDEMLLKCYERRDVMKNAIQQFLETGVVEGALRDDLDVRDLHLVLIGPMLLRGRLIEDGLDSSAEAALQIIWDGIKK